MSEVQNAAKAEVISTGDNTTKPEFVPFEDYEKAVQEINRINNIAVQFREQLIKQSQELQLLRGGFAISRINFFIDIVKNGDLFPVSLVNRIKNELEGELFPPEQVEGELTEGAGI